MTFTQTYIQMMKESPIQKEWKPRVGDWYWHKEDKLLFLYEGMTSEHQSIQRFPIDKRYHIWLPTSDDWWEMLLPIFRKIAGDNEPMTIDELLTTVSIFCFEGKTIEQWPWNNKDISILELLSAFYHHERWGMRWESERWSK